MQLAAFIAALAWYFCAQALAASAAAGLGLRFDLGAFATLLEAVFQVFLVGVGVWLLAAIERRRAPLRLTMGLPIRRSAFTEWAEGAAIGWGVALASVLPLVLTGALDVRFWTAPRGWELAIVNLLALALFALAVALGIYGYGLQRLIEASSPTRATMVMALLALLYVGFNPRLGGQTGLRATVAFAAASLLCLCWVRTHGLWMLWGLYFSWTAVVGVIFGLPVGGSQAYSSVVESRSLGPVWLTGGEFGPGAGLVTLIAILGAALLVIRVTSDYAWNYTHPPIIPGGFEVDVPPPAAHSAMESAAPAPPPLVQILPTAPTGPDASSRQD